LLRDKLPLAIMAESGYDVSLSRRAAGYSMTGRNEFWYLME
jgi:hypothetical protein